jgi:hypothetical protein
MSKGIVFGALAAAGIGAVCTSGCGQVAAQQMKLDAHRSLGKPITFRNLSVVPVYDSRATGRDTYMTLDEGLKAKSVQVKEGPSGGDVNRLFVTNSGPKPVYLIAGEVVLGGQQDRCIGKDTVIPPSKRPIPITVFCVEHGRWSGEAHFAVCGTAVAASTIRASAQDGAVASGKTATARAARIGESQSKVWDEVAAKNRRFGAAPSSGTYRDVLQGTGGRSGTSTAPYIRALLGAIPWESQLTGVVVAINGKAVAADMFAEPALFRKLWPKLLRSYASDAAEASSGNGAPTRTATAAEARTFIIGAASGKSRTIDSSVAGVVTRLESPKAVLFRSAPAMAGGAAASKPVHENYLGK